MLITVKRIILLIAVLFVFSCENTDILQKYHKSVVMLYSEYVYKLTINDKVFYFNYDEKSDTASDLTPKMDQVPPMGLYGTGFFIDDQGTIVTNRHVVHHLSTEEEEKFRNQLRKKILESESEYMTKADSATNEINLWTNKFYDNQRSAFPSDSISRWSTTQIGLWQNIQKDAEKNKLLMEGLLSVLPESKFDVQIIYIGFATDGSTINSISDFKPCHLLNYSKEDDIDLAIIQANDHKLPDETTDFISIDDISDEPLRAQQPVSLLGYNLGPQISVTKTGLNVQITQGTVSQASDGVQVLYSISALQGSSGSPVFSSDGKLVAVNYKGYSSQGFNYGILATHIKDLLKSN